MSDITELERRDYYYGLPSCPILVFRTGAPWKKPTGPEAYSIPKAIKPVFDNKFADVWEDMGTRIYKYLDSVAVKWTTIDVVRFAEPGKYSDRIETVGPIVLWIGVIPKSLSRELLDTVPSKNPIAEFCGPLTASLGLPIASIQTPYAEGIGGLYLSPGDNSEMIYLLTARHVVLPQVDGAGIGFDHRESIQEPVQVMVPGPEAFNNMIDRLESRRKYWLDRSKDEEERASVESDLREEGVLMKMLKDFNNNVICDWSQEENRIIGRVLYAPPIGHEDWALIELDRSKIDWPNFKGNMIDLGTKMTYDKFVKLMRPHTYYYKYPRFSIQGVIPEDELMRPIKRDTNGEPYSKLMKNCSRNETDVGCGNGIKSFVREYFSDGTEQTSLEFAILPDKIRSAFSWPGDSGSIIVDSEGRAAALLRIKAKFPNVHLYPTEDELF
ncbi:hypothetical protein BDQ17DRAFT_1366837 [Cyathus striatus]|nr:hypothetical protein BDQ17DRAFT_1366837 [Cyathus striatus]